MNYIDCKSIAQKWKDEVKAVDGQPKLVIVQVGHDPASDVYVKGKLRDAEEVGILAVHETIHDGNKAQVMDDIISTLKKHSPSADGIIVQMPLPFRLTMQDVIPFLPEGSQDVDGFSPESPFYPCTPDAVMELLNDLDVKIKGKHCVVVGRSDLVTKPLADGLQNYYNATVTVCHSYTPKGLLRSLAGQADIFITAAGQPVIGTDAFKPGAIVIDIGIHRRNGKIVGDIWVTDDRDDIRITPVPGGIGLLTRAMLMRHVADSYQERKRNEDEQEV